MKLFQKSERLFENKKSYYNLHINGIQFQSGYTKYLLFRSIFSKEGISAFKVDVLQFESSYDGSLRVFFGLFIPLLRNPVIFQQSCT